MYPTFNQEMNEMRSAPGFDRANSPCGCGSRFVRRSHICRGLLTLFLVALSAQLRGEPAALANQPAGGAKRLLVIAPNAFHPALQDFVAHKQTLQPTELRSLEKILEQNRGVDDPEKLKRFLYE